MRRMVTARAPQGRRTGLDSGLLKECGGHWPLLGLDDVNKLLPEGQAALVPAAGAIDMLHADIMLGLVPIELPFQQPVCPEALIGG